MIKMLPTIISIKRYSLFTHKNLPLEVISRTYTIPFTISFIIEWFLYKTQLKDGSQEFGRLCRYG